MKHVPMIFNSAMVKALLDGRKTVTRRPLRIPEGWELADTKLSKITSSHPKKGKWGALVRSGVGAEFPQADLITAPCSVGDLVWVRETFCMGRIDEHDADHPADRYKYVEQCEGDSNYSISKAQCEMDSIEVHEVKWTPSIHMPKAASRITLKVTDVRIERVTDISDEQAVSEGMPSREEAQRMAVSAGLDWYDRPTKWFKRLWQQIYGDESWSQAQFVWVIEFEMINQNVTNVAA